MALNDYETELFAQDHYYGSGEYTPTTKEINNETVLIAEQGSMEIPISNSPQQLVVKSGYVMLDQVDENTTQHIQVIFTHPFPHRCVSVIVSPMVDYEAENVIHNPVVVRRRTEGFKCLYKREYTNGTMTSSSNYGRISWIAFGY